MNLMSRVELLRGKLPYDAIETMSTILCHSFKGNSLVCNHASKQCWKDSSNPYYFSLMCHMIFCRTSLCDTDSVISLVDLANQITAFATVTCSKELQVIMRRKAGNYY